MELIEVDPLTPQPGDWVRIYTPIVGEDPDHPYNWTEGLVERNTTKELLLNTGDWVLHAYDTDLENTYYMRK